MNQFLFKAGCAELQPFEQILEFAQKKNTTIQLNSLQAVSSEYLRLYYIIEGKFTWKIDTQNPVLYPGDLAIILPGQIFGGEKDFLDIGSLAWLTLKVRNLGNTGKAEIGNWINLSASESRTIGKVLVLNNNPILAPLKEAGVIFHEIQQEIVGQQIGYITRVNQLLAELFIIIARQLTRQNNSGRDFPQTFMKLEQSLRSNLAHQWTVEEMAALVGLGTTAFAEKVKNYSGFSPLNYLINIRISEAIKLLKKPSVNMTDIALDTGFYSSQHFATTFKKLTGYTPSEFRKKTFS